LPKYVEIEFERGGKFALALSEDEAPHTCKAIWDALPLESEAQHAQYSGQLMFWFTPTIHFDELENPKLMGLFQGDLAFNPHSLHRLHVQAASVAVPQEIFYVYGGCIPADRCGPSPVNHFARTVQGSLQELAEIGKRTRRRGFEKVWMRRR
jgi:hypothetical protein